MKCISILIFCVLLFEVYSEENQTLVFNSQIGYYLQNVTAQKVVLFDYINYLNLYYNGQTGEIFIFSYENTLAVYLSPKSSQKTWKASDENFDAYLKNQPVPINLYLSDKKNGIEFDGQTITKEAENALGDILFSLSMDYTPSSKAFGNAIEVSKFFYINKLQGFLKSFRDVRTEIQLDLHWMLGLFEGLKLCFKPFPGELNALSRKKIHLDFDKVATLESGPHLFAYLLRRLSPRFNLRRIWKETLNSQWRYFDLICKLAGNIRYGCDGFLCSISAIVKYQFGEISEENLIVVLTEYFTHKRSENNDLETKWRVRNEVVEKALKELKLERDFKEVSKVLNDIKEKKWFINGCNMTEVVEIVIQERLPGDEKSARKVLDALKKK